MNRHKKNIFKILVISFLALFLGGCTYNMANNLTVDNGQNKKIDVKTVDIKKFYNGEDGLSLSIPSGNNSTCIWTYEGGSAAVPYSITTNANTATEKHTIAYYPGSNYNFKVSCFDDFGEQYIGIFPAN